MMPRRPILSSAAASFKLLGRKKNDNSDIYDIPYMIEIIRLIPQFPGDKSLYPRI